MPIWAMLGAHAARFPDRAAVVTESASLGYAELVRRADRLARWLVAAGLHPGDVVGLSIREPIWHVVASVALMRLGCPQVLLATHDPASLREAVARRCGVAAILAADAADAVGAFGPLVPDFDAIVAKPAAGGRALPVLPTGDAGKPDIASVILPSSGTTGRPKLVPLTQRQILAQAVNGRGDGPHEVCYRPVSIEYNNAKRQNLYALCHGATHVAVDPARWVTGDVCRAFGVNALMCSPTQARALIDTAPGDGGVLLDDTRLYLSGSGIAPDLVVAASRRLTRHVHVVYGITECARIAIAGPDRADRPAGSVGRPLPDVAVEIADDEGRSLPVGKPGQIRVRTPGMVDRYVDDPQLSARAFRDGWFHPGDAGYFEADGELIFQGRVDDMMNLNSIKLFPAEIERVMERFPGVVECAAFPLRSTVHGDIPILAVAARDGLDIDRLLAFGREHLGTRAPRKIVQVASLPRNAADKIMIAELQKLVGLDSRQTRDTGQ